jgi:hypothetical protein
VGVDQRKSLALTENDGFIPRKQPRRKLMSWVDLHDEASQSRRESAVHYRLEHRCHAAGDDRTCTGTGESLVKRIGATHNPRGANFSALEKTAIHTTCSRPNCHMQQGRRKPSGNEIPNQRTQGAHAQRITAGDRQCAKKPQNAGKRQQCE